MFQLLRSIFFFFFSTNYLFIYWSITDAKLFFETATQLGMMTDNTVRLECVCILLLRGIFS